MNMAYDFAHTFAHDFTLAAIFLNFAHTMKIARKDKGVFLKEVL